MMLKQIDRPLFMVGVPRSGTNIFYRTFAKHPDLAWISNGKMNYKMQIKIP